MPQWTWKWTSNGVNCSASCFFFCCFFLAVKLQDGKSGTKDSLHCLILRPLKSGITIKCDDLSTAGHAVAGDVVQNQMISQFCQFKCFSLLVQKLTKNVILQKKAFKNSNSTSCKTAFSTGRGKKLQLQCSPAPPLINPRWLAAGVWGLLQTHMQLTLGECSWWQPRRTLHHLIEMKSVTSWPVFQHLHQHPPPSLPRPVSPAAALRWRAAGVKTPSATELLGVNEPCSIRAWRALFLVRTLLQDAAQL